jgi:hypothetical protein
VPIVEVPLAQGQSVRLVDHYFPDFEASCMILQRIATSGAPQVHEDDLVHAEDFDSSDPSPNPNLQQLSKAVHINTGEHRSGPFCFCL